MFIPIGVDSGNAQFLKTNNINCISLSDIFNIKHKCIETNNNKGYELKADKLNRISKIETIYEALKKI